MKAVQLYFVMLITGTMAFVIGALLSRVDRLSKELQQRNEVLDRYIEIRCKELGLK